MLQNGTMDKHLKKKISFPTKKCLLLVFHACARQESSKVSNRLTLSNESPKKLPRPHFALSSQIPAFKWGKCRISKDLSGTLYATTPPHLHIGNRHCSCQQNPVLLGTRTLNLPGGFQVVTMAIPLTAKTTNLPTHNWTGLMSPQPTSLVVRVGELLITKTAKIRPSTLTTLNRLVTTIVSVVTVLIPHLRQIRM